VHVHALRIAFGTIISSAILEVANSDRDWVMQSLVVDRSFHHALRRRDGRRFSRPAREDSCGGDLRGTHPDPARADDGGCHDRRHDPYRIRGAGEEQNAALARAVIGGLLFATPTTLLVVYPYHCLALRRRRIGTAFEFRLFCPK
jgi:hypothetical protein